MPYRREMTLAFADEGFTQTTSTWRRVGGNDSPLARTTYTAKLDGKEYPVEASAAKVVFKRVDANDHRAHGSRRSRRHGDRDLDALLRSQGADDRDQRQGRRRRRRTAARRSTTDDRWHDRSGPSGSSR